jgi:hypothetical protein
MQCDKRTMAISGRQQCSGSWTTVSGFAEIMVDLTDRFWGGELDFLKWGVRIPSLPPGVAKLERYFYFYNQLALSGPVGKYDHLIGLQKKIWGAIAWLGTKKMCKKYLNIENISHSEWNMFF